MQVQNSTDTEKAVQDSKEVNKPSRVCPSRIFPSRKKLSQDCQSNRPSARIAATPYQLQLSTELSQGELSSSALSTSQTPTPFSSTNQPSTLILWTPYALVQSALVQSAPTPSPPFLSARTPSAIIPSYDRSVVAAQAHPFNRFYRCSRRTFVVRRFR